MNTNKAHEICKAIGCIHNRIFEHPCDRDVNAEYQCEMLTNPVGLLEEELDYETRNAINNYYAVNQ